MTYRIFDWRFCYFSACYIIFRFGIESIAYLWWDLWSGQFWGSWRPAVFQATLWVGILLAEALRKVAYRKWKTEG